MCCQSFAEEQSRGLGGWRLCKGEFLYLGRSMTKWVRTSVTLTFAKAASNSSLQVYLFLVLMSGRNGASKVAMVGVLADS